MAEASPPAAVACSFRPSCPEAARGADIDVRNEHATAAGGEAVGHDPPDAARGARYGDPEPNEIEREECAGSGYHGRFPFSRIEDDSAGPSAVNPFFRRIHCRGHASVRGQRWAAA